MKKTVKGTDLAASRQLGVEKKGKIAEGGKYFFKDIEEEHELDSNPNGKGRR